MSPETSPQPVDLSVAPKRRLHALDGLRGVAATVVVCYHLILVVPALAQAYINADAAPGTIEWFLYRTPLRLFFAGHEAVLIFFVLSGFVLTLPLRPSIHQAGSWLAYYGRRLVRLYLPVWGSLVFALVLAMLVARNVNAQSPWIAAHKPPSAGKFATDLVLLIGTSNLNSPLWSLRWEMWFSLLLPLMFLVIILIRMNRWWIPGVVLLALVSAVAQLSSVTHVLPNGLAGLVGGLLQYLPVFGIGMLLALNLDSLDRIAKRLREARGSRAIWAVLVVASLLCIVSPSFVEVKGSGFGLGDAVAYFLSVAGVVVVLFAAIEARPFGRFLERRPVQWLGTRSFSIYLVHEPIVVAVALLTKADGWIPWIFIAIALLPVIFLVAEGFYRLVERPTIGLSRAVGRRLGRRKSAPRVSVGEPAAS